MMNLNFFSLFEKRSSKKMTMTAIEEKPQEFSKTLLIQESLLIWITTVAILVLAYICVFNQYFAEIPWLTAMVALPWTAYAVSQHAYYKKSQAENTKDGITYETAMADIFPEYEQNNNDNEALG